MKFLVAATGEKLNPQSKIVAAIAELVVSDWTMRFRCSASLSLSHTLTCPVTVSPLAVCPRRI